jgi:hypothetical protein
MEIKTLREQEISSILLALEKTNGNEVQAANRLGVTRSILRHRMQKYAINFKRKLVIEDISKPVIKNEENLEQIELSEIDSLLIERDELLEQLEILHEYIRELKDDRDKFATIIANWHVRDEKKDIKVEQVEVSVKKEEIKIAEPKLVYRYNPPPNTELEELFVSKIEDYIIQENKAIFTIEDMLVAVKGVDGFKNRSISNQKALILARLKKELIRPKGRILRLARGMYSLKVKEVKAG